jgi:putative acetyltransferase
MDAAPDIRLAQASDYDSLASVMFEAVRNGPTAYTPQQCEAWVPTVRRGAEWSERLAKQHVLLAEYQQRVIGFISLGPGGYVDLAFIVPKFQKTGLFRQLYNGIEEAARVRGEHRLWVHASVMAQPAFSAVGFEIVREQTVEVAAQRLRRFEMQKCLDSIPQGDG